LLLNKNRMWKSATHEASGQAQWVFHSSNKDWLIKNHRF
jgi:hypothetical protein